MVQKSILARIVNESEFHTFPFNHRVCSSVFSKTELKLLLSQFPTTNEMQPFGVDKFGSSRFHLFLDEISLESIESKQKRNYWIAFLSKIRAFAEKDKLTIIQKYPDFFPVDEINTDQVSLSIRLVEEHLPFFLPPHIDKPQKLGVAVIYLDSEGGDERNGTYLFVKNENNDSGSIHGGFWKGKGFRRTLHVYIYKHSKEQKDEIRRKFPNLF